MAACIGNDLKIAGIQAELTLWKVGNAWSVQAAMFEWTLLQFGKHPRAYAYIPYRQLRHPAEAWNLKAQGVKPGYRTSACLFRAGIDTGCISS
jgi:hypothetical protein